MNCRLERSVVLTGPSASGKTTLHVCMTVHFCLVPDPVHATRPLRRGEVPGVDIRPVTEDEYMRNFETRLYLEESPQAAYFSGSYYGTPKAWVEATLRGDFNCFVCPTVKVAKRIKEALGDSVFWVHMHASERVRHARLARRNPEMNRENLDARLNRGSQNVDITGHDLCIDTTWLGAYDIFQKAVAPLLANCGPACHNTPCSAS